MNKFKVLILSLVAALSLGVTSTFSTVQATESLTPNISVASDTIWYSKEVPYTTTQSMWVTVNRNGKTYSGYIYNRGFGVDNVNYSFFSGTLRVGPYAPTNVEHE
ncbi:MAG: hypothetical protein ABS944_14825 [Solibacillus sp.]|jgi:hypothetical protein|uniref:hypothetical protein n=1 Tax=Solibacillus sp. TaxID=1909654 RepID=UPI0033152BD2